MDMSHDEAAQQEKEVYGKIGSTNKWQLRLGEKTRPMHCACHCDDNTK
jgi:hypothetical protein